MPGIVELSVDVLGICVVRASFYVVLWFENRYHF